MEIPRRRYEIIEPYFLPNISWNKTYLENKELLDRIDLETILLHLLYCIKWCSIQQNDYWIQNDKKILENYIIEFIEIFKKRMKRYYEEFSLINPEIKKYELSRTN